MLIRMILAFVVLTGVLSFLAHLILRTKYFKAKDYLAFSKVIGILIIGVVSALTVLVAAVNFRL